MKGAGKKPLAGKAAALAAQFPLMALMCMSMVYPFTTALDFGLSFLTVLLTVLACLGFWAAALYNGKTALCLLALAVVGGAVFYFSISGGSESSAVFRAKLDVFLYWAGMYLKGYRTTNLQYAAWLVALFSAAVTLMVFVFTFKQFDLMTVLLSGAACYVALVVIGHVVDLPALFAYILAATLYIILSGYRKNAGATSGERTMKLPAYMASALPLAAIVLVCTILLSGFAEIDPSWMKDFRGRLLHKNETVSQQTTKASDKQVFSSDELGGNVYLTNEVVMEVESPVQNVHLRALSKSRYTGHSWVRTDTEQSYFFAESFDDTALTKSLIAGDPDMMNELFPSVDISVKYKDFNTGIVYAPLKLSSLDIGAPVTLVGTDELLLANGYENDLAYGLKYYQPAYGNSRLADLARKAGEASPFPLVHAGNVGFGFSDGGVVQRVQIFEGRGEVTMDGDRYYAIPNSAYALSVANGVFADQYMQLPDTLPQRIRDLADEITKDATNDYDKAVAIEDYLRHNFSYTLTPGGSDLDRDFVDQFLFEGKRGYCTYFATAMVVLLRCEGVPARYVEGYVLPGYANSRGVYEVTKKQGHAWVEVYFEGLGWLTFEPTPFSSDNAPTETPTRPPAQTSTPPPSPTPRGSSAPVVNPGETPPGLKPAVLFLPAALLAAFAALALFAAYIPYRAKARLRKMRPREASVHLFGQLLKLLEAQGEPLCNGENLEAFARQVDKSCGLPRHGFADATDIFQQARFSDHDISPEQQQKLTVFRKEFLQASKKKLGLFKYLYFKYIWGI
jgi:transglutaminase-like putative cysteine protease